MTEISSFIQGFDDRSQLERQVDAANQRNNWLRQMELAQWAEMNKNNELHEAGGKRDGSRQGALRVSTPDESQCSSILATTGNSPDATTHTQKTSSDMTENGDLTEVSATMHDTPISSVGWTARDMAVLLSAGKCPETRTPTEAVTAMVAAHTDGIQTRTSQQSIDVSVMQSALLSPLSLPGKLASTKDGNLRDAKSGETASLPTEAQQSEAPTWQKRLLHVTGDGQDVAVWIRDSELDLTESSTLVSRLAGEFSDSGLRLKRVTVNGKLEYRANDPNLPDDDHFMKTTREQEMEPKNPITTATREDHAA